MSKHTALTSTIISRPARLLHSKSLITGHVLDYGCGHGRDVNSLRSLSLRKDSPIISCDGWDPYWGSYRSNPHRRKYDTITCTYVLNVVTEEEQEYIFDDIWNHLKKGGSTYITVRRDINICGQQGRGCWQRYVILDLPIITENSNFCIYELTRT